MGPKGLHYLPRFAQLASDRMELNPRKPGSRAMLIVGVPPLSQVPFLVQMKYALLATSQPVPILVVCTHLVL